MSGFAMKEITGRHVLIGLAGFFGVMLIANGLFVYFALSTFEGVDNPNAYEEGLRYNERIEAERRQAALGWSHAVTIRQTGRIELAIRDRESHPVSGLTISGQIARPVAAETTQPLVFQESAPGLYAASADGLTPGGWIVSIEAVKPHRQGPETLYRLKDRLWLKPNS